MDDKSIEYANYDLYKEGYYYNKLAVKHMIRAIIKKTPREVLIEVLKDLKIIEQDWTQNENKFRERKNEIPN